MKGITSFYYPAIRPPAIQCTNESAMTPDEATLDAVASTATPGVVAPAVIPPATLQWSYLQSYNSTMR